MDIMNFLNSIDTFPTVFYGQFSAIGFSISTEGSLQLKIAKLFEDKKGSGRPQAGQKRYDWDNEVYFTLNISECIGINANFKAILSGSYVNEFEQNSDYKNQYKVIHYNNDKKPSYFSLQRKDSSLIVSIKDFNGNYASVALTNNPSKNIFELYSFSQLIENTAKYSIYNSLFVKSVVKGIKKSLFDNSNNNNNNNNNNSQNNSGYNRNNSNTNYKSNQQEPRQNINTTDDAAAPPWDNSNNGMSDNSESDSDNSDDILQMLNS